MSPHKSRALRCPVLAKIPAAALRNETHRRNHPPPRLHPCAAPNPATLAVAPAAKSPLWETGAKASQTPRAPAAAAHQHATRRDPPPPASTAPPPPAALPACPDTADPPPPPHRRAQSIPAQSDPKPAATRSPRSPATHHKSPRATAANAPKSPRATPNFPPPPRSPTAAPEPCAHAAAISAATSGREKCPRRRVRHTRNRSAAESNAARENPHSSRQPRQWTRIAKDATLRTSPACSAGCRSIPPLHKSRNRRAPPRILPPPVDRKPATPPSAIFSAHPPARASQAAAPQPEKCRKGWPRAIRDTPAGTAVRPASKVVSPIA